MSFIDNRRWLGQYFSKTIEVIRKWDDQVATGNMKVETSRKGTMTLRLNVDGAMKYIYSKYDPMKDSERLLKQFNSESSGIALFFGAGLGYHIDAFIKKYPHRKFAIIEPNEEVFLAYMKYSKFAEIKRNNIIGMHVGEQENQSFMQEVLEKSKGEIQFITLPYYDEIYSEELNRLKKMMLAYLKYRKQSLAVDISFQLRWTLNVLNNFPTLLETPNFLYENRVDEDQVAILVAAGPSLDYEIENLRKIKQDDSAYIFSVGSAINALIENDIYPDATLSYDPTHLNEKVIQKVKDEGITEIPLIYGSSVGFEVLKDYPGEIYHLIMTQDKLSGHVLQAEKDIPVLRDAPSIAVVTLQMLIQLGFKRIILVGQNLGYTGEYRYAQGIEYDHVDAKLTQQEFEKEIIYTMDVDGKEIQTKEGFERMKEGFEHYIRLAPGVTFVNTTVGGAKIKGTEYKRLGEVMEEGILFKGEESNLFDVKNPYNLAHVEERLTFFKKEKRNVVSELENAIEKLKEIQRAASLNRPGQLERLFGEFDRAYAEVERNQYYQFIVKSTLRVQFDQLTEFIGEIKYENDVIRKAYIIMDAFNTYLNAIYKHHLFLEPHFEELLEESMEIIEWYGGGGK